MGNCFEHENIPNAPTDAQTYKILFLGSSNSGKSTIFKQLRKLYGNGFAAKDRIDAKISIAAFVFELFQACLNELPHDMFTYNEYDANLMIAAQEIQSIDLSRNQQLTNVTAAYINTLWSHNEIKQTCQEIIKEYQMTEQFVYFLQHIDRILATNFKPTDKDILMLRRPTTGLIERYISKTEYKNIQFLMVDVGGTKNERRKWIHHFENVSAVIYVISLSSYNEMLFEDENINSLNDAIKLFGEIVNNQQLHNAFFCVVFNKKDIFAQRILDKSLSCLNCEEYDENQYFIECNNCEMKIDKNFQFIKRMCLNKIKVQRTVHTLVTCAHNDNEIKNKFDQIFAAIVDGKDFENNMEIIVKSSYVLIHGYLKQYECNLPNDVLRIIASLFGPIVV
eukprot:473380_1